MFHVYYIHTHTHTQPMHTCGNYYVGYFSFPECTLLKTLHLNDSPESLAFTVVDDTDELIIGVRDTAYLLYFNCNSLKESRVSLNEHDWDTHCSFTPLCLSVSPDRSLLLVASDKHMHYIYRICTNIRLVTLAGHTCSEYGRPRCVFDRSGKYVYTNSEQDSHVHVRFADVFPHYGKYFVVIFPPLWEVFCCCFVPIMGCVLFLFSFHISLCGTLGTVHGIHNAYVWLCVGVLDSIQEDRVQHAWP